MNELRHNLVRASAGFGTDPIKVKIAEAEKAKVHTMLVIGPRDVESGAVSVHLHGKGNVGARPKAEVIADLLAAIKERRAQLVVAAQTGSLRYINLRLGKRSS